MATTTKEKKPDTYATKVRVISGWIRKQAEQVTNRIFKKWPDTDPSELNQLRRDVGLPIPSIDPINAMDRDLRIASATLSDEEARYLVDTYYIMQETRKRTRNQERALSASQPTPEPHMTISWLGDNSNKLEEEISKALKEYVLKRPMGQWMCSIYGIGHILAAGLMAHIYMGHWCAHCRGHDPDDCARRQANTKLKLPKHRFEPIESCPTAGHIWSYAGIAGTGQRPWRSGEKRPWNASLKTHCWRIGDTFVKFSNNDDCYYGKLYRERKEQEVMRNERGDFKAQADDRIARDEKRGRKSKERAYHDEGKLSPGHLDLRARRYAVKIFLAHMHGEWYRQTFKKQPPAPYPIAFLGHVHQVPPPPIAAE